MLSGSPKTQLHTTRLFKPPTNASSRCLSSTSAVQARTRPGFSENDSRRGGRKATGEQSRFAFGFLSSGKPAWVESDPQFKDENPDLTLRFCQAPKERAKLRPEGKPRESKGSFALIEQGVPESKLVNDQRGNTGYLHHQVQRYGLSSDLLGMIGSTEDAYMKAFIRQRAFVGRSDVSGVSESSFASSSRDAVTIEPTHLMIQDFKGTRSELAPLVDLFMGSQVHLVPIQTSNGLRIDVLMKFSTRTDVLRARSLLEDKRYEVQVIDQNQWMSVFNCQEQKSSEVAFTSPPTIVDVDDRPRKLITTHSGSHPTLWLGNVPYELLGDRAGIIARFSKYGKIMDVKIRNKGISHPRGYVFLEFLRQEDADSCFQELTERPLFLFGRRLSVDYASPPIHALPPLTPNQSLASKRSRNTVFLSCLSAQLSSNPWELLDAVSFFGEIVDLRFVSSTRGSALVDFMHANDAERMIEEVTSGTAKSLPPGIKASYGTKFTPNWDGVINPPSDTLKAWGIPFRALSNETTLREAFGDKDKLLEIRIPKRPDGWPTGCIYLYFTSVEAAKETLDWMHSDPRNPLTFFGREIRANFVEGPALRGTGSRPNTAVDDVSDLSTEDIRSRDQTQNERKE